MIKTKRHNSFLFLIFAFILLFTVSTVNFAFEIKDILSAPFPGSLTTASSGQRIAWVFNREGIHNIWIAQGPEFKAKQLTGFEKDDGRPIRIYGFMNQNESIAFTKWNRFNPDQNPSWTKEPSIYLVDWETGRQKEIAKAGHAAVSPQGDRLAFLKDNHIWIWAGPGTEPQQKAFVEGNLANLQWSPRSSRLALESHRGKPPYRYSYITVYDVEQNRVTYIDASIYSDTKPVWSPDGSKLAFIRRLTHDHNNLINSKIYPVPDPWEIRVKSFSNGQCRPVWKSPNFDSFSYVTLNWLNDDHLVFTSEADGWRHFYAVSRMGGKAKQLTSGSFEVEQFIVDSKLEKIIFNSNAGDIDRRHIWFVGPDGRKEMETKGNSIEWSPRLTGDKQYLVFFGSDATHPAQVYVKPFRKGKSKLIARSTLPQKFPRHLITPRQVILKSEDGWTIHGQLFMPDKKFKGKRPAVMFFHGGPIRQMLLGFHYSNYYHRAYAMNQYLASRGCVVFSVNYRLGIGYGREFREVADGGPRGCSEYQDLLAGAKYLRGLDRVDSRRIGLWGGSYGGLMTALGLARNSDLFAAGVDFHGVHDWNRWVAWSRKQENQNDRTLWKSSPIADLKQWRSPVLLVHGDNDQNVPFSETVWLAEQLKKQNVDCRLLIFPDEVHSFLLHRNWVKAYRAAASFFRQTLDID